MAENGEIPEELSPVDRIPPKEPLPLPLPLPLAKKQSPVEREKREAGEREGGGRGTSRVARLPSTSSMASLTSSSSSSLPLSTSRSTLQKKNTVQTAVSAVVVTRASTVNSIPITSVRMGKTLGDKRHSVPQSVLASTDLKTIVGGVVSTTQTRVAANVVSSAATVRFSMPLTPTSGPVRLLSTVVPRRLLPSFQSPRPQLYHRQLWLLVLVLVSLSVWYPLPLGCQQLPQSSVPHQSQSNRQQTQQHFQPTRSKQAILLTTTIRPKPQ